MSDTRRNILGIEKSGSLYFLLNSLIGAYNRRTDLMVQPSADFAIMHAKLDKILKAVETDPAKIEALTNQTKASREELQDAIDTQTK